VRQPRWPHRRCKGIRKLFVTKLLVLGALGLHFLAAQIAVPREVTGINYSASGQTTTITVEVSGDFEYATGRLHQPERAYFDIRPAKPRIDSRSVYSREFESELLERVRVAEHAPDVTRVVLDLFGPADISVSKLSAPAGLVITLRPPPAGRGSPQAPPPALPTPTTGLPSRPETAAGTPPVPRIHPPSPPAPAIRLPPIRDTRGTLTPEDWIALATLAMAAVIAALAVFTALLVRRLGMGSDQGLLLAREAFGTQAENTNKALAVSDRHAANGEKTAEAAKIAADATAQMVAHLMQERRAWVVVPPPRVARLAELRRLAELGPPDSWGVLQVPLVVMNRGQSMAVIQLAKACLMILPEDEELPPEPHDEGPHFASIRGSIPLPPNSSYQLLMPSLGDFRFTDIHTGVTRLWLYGVVEYKDNFEEPHRSRFCFVYYHEGVLSPLSTDFYIAGPEKYNSFS
jgi:hypothetical protein